MLPQNILENDEKDLGVTEEEISIKSEIKKPETNPPKIPKKKQKIYHDMCVQVENEEVQQSPPKEIKIDREPEYYNYDFRYSDVENQKVNTLPPIEKSETTRKNKIIRRNPSGIQDGEDSFENKLQIRTLRDSKRQESPKPQFRKNQNQQKQRSESDNKKEDQEIKIKPEKDTQKPQKQNQRHRFIPINLQKTKTQKPKPEK